VQFTPGKMLGLISQSESTPPLYYCVAWVWARVLVSRRPVRLTPGDVARALHATRLRRDVPELQPD
jgi:hypothetical protein